MMETPAPRTPQTPGDAPTSALAPFDALYEATRAGDPLPLPPALAALYGPLTFPAPADRPHVFANFVTTLDGIVAFDLPQRPGGGDISGHSAHDRALMGLLRAAADAVVAGAGTLRAEPKHIWTPAHIFPPLAAAYAALRAALGQPEPPLNVLVTARGDLDLSLPVFTAGQAPVLLVTTTEGAAALRRHAVPLGVQITEVAERGPLAARAVLAAVSAARPCHRILLEGGPHLLGDFLAEGLLDEQFLTLAPQLAGRDGVANRPALVAGHLFAPDAPLWGQLVSVRRAGDHLFLRYALPH